MNLTFEGSRNLVEEFWSAIEQKRFALLSQLCDEGIVYHGPGGAELRGIFQVASLYRVFDASFPGMSAKLETCVIDDDLVVCRVRASWEQQPVTSARMMTPCQKTHSFMSTVRVLDGYIVEEWATFGPMDLLSQSRELLAA